MTLRKSAVVALGNPLAGPDGFGEAVAGRLRATSSMDDAADILTAGTDLLGLLDTLADYDALILVDVVIDAARASSSADSRSVDGAPAGSVQQPRVFEERDFASWESASAGSHAVSPLVAIGLLRRLHPGRVPHLCLVGWPIPALHRGEPVPAQVVEQAAALVAGCLHRLTTRQQPASGGE